MIVIVLLFGLASLACWIYTLVRLFQTGNTVLGVCGICPLVGFIAGWVKAQEMDHQKVMMIWTGVVVVNIILNIMLR